MHVFSLTCRRLRLLEETDLLFQIVGTDPRLILLSVPFTWTARVKQSLVKCKEHTPNWPFGLKFLRCVKTNFFHFASPLPLGGEPCIEIPNSKSAVWSQSWITHRRGGILKIFYQQQATQRSHRWHGKLAAFTLSDARMTSDPRRSS